MQIFVETLTGKTAILEVPNGRAEQGHCQRTGGDRAVPVGRAMHRPHESEWQQHAQVGSPGILESRRTSKPLQAVARARTLPEA